MLYVLKNLDGFVRLVDILNCSLFSLSMSTNKPKDILDVLFGSKIRVRILKFLFRNYPNDFSVTELSKRIQEPYAATKKEIDLLAEIRLIKKN